MAEALGQVVLEEVTQQPDSADNKNSECATKLGEVERERAEDNIGNATLCP